MSTTGSNGANNVATTPSATSQQINIPEPRCCDLSEQEYALYVRSVVYVHQGQGFGDETLSRGQLQRKSHILEDMTEEQKRTFPLMAEEEYVIFDLEDAQEIKEDLEELVRELGLEAVNEIDLGSRRS